MKTGYWNGELGAEFVGVTYEVVKCEETPLHWQNMFVGNRRQGVQITYEGSTWIIDNEHGDGYYKVTKGQGSPRCGHKSIFNPTNILEIDDNEINVKYDIDKLKSEDIAHNKYIEENNPEEYKKILALRKMIEDGYSKSRPKGDENFYN